MSAIRDILKEKYIHCFRNAFRHNNIYEFHHIGRGYSIKSPEITMENFSRFIQEHGPYVSLKEIMSSGEFDGKCAITFDDGYEEVYTAAFPFLTERGIPFTAFVLSDEIGKPGFMTADEVTEMSGHPLVTIGSHCCHHVRLSTLSSQEKEHEIVQSKKDLEDLLGKPCDMIAYPFGDFDQETKNIVESAGYTYAMAVKGRPMTRFNSKDPLEVPRLSIYDESLRFYA